VWTPSVWLAGAERGAGQKEPPKEAGFLRGFALQFKCEKERKEECQAYLTGGSVGRLLGHCDAELAEKCRLQGCLLCGGALHRAFYPRKPRGLFEAEWAESRRHSFCCGREGCRKRHTPPSVRFLGRRVYVGVVVVLVSALRHGVTPARFEVLREKLGIDRRTAERWRRWWLEEFSTSRVWRAARGCFKAAFSETRLPLSLCEAFGVEELEGWVAGRGEQGERRNRLLNLLGFLSPLSGSAHLFERGF